jgi:hypothetical protein
MTLSQIDSDGALLSPELNHPFRCYVYLTRRPHPCDSWTASPNPMFIFATVHHCYVGPRLMPLTSGQSFSAPDMPHPTRGVPHDIPSEPLPTFLKWRQCQPCLACVSLLFRSNLALNTTFRLVAVICLPNAIQDCPFAPE